MSDLLERSWATISGCGNYRYSLGRSWGPGPIACFIMLNPSTADAEEDDPTIRRCRSFAQRERCGSLIVVNLFAWRATDPKYLFQAQQPVGPENDQRIASAILLADGSAGPIIAAWGAHKAAGYRAGYIIRKFGNLKCLGITKEGHPRHPLYVKGDAPLVRYPTTPPAVPTNEGNTR